MKCPIALALVGLLAPLCLSLPAQEEQAEEAAPPPSAARFQGESVKAELAGTEEYRAIQAGVSWLLENQSVDGAWSTDAGAPSVSATALAILALLGDGNSPLHGEQREAMTRAEYWLLAQQEEKTGRIGADRLQDHAIAMVALWELWRHGNSGAAREAAEAAARFLYEGEVWSKRDDLAELAWCVAAATQVMESGVMDQAALKSVRDWINSTIEKTGKIAPGGTPELKERGTALLLWPRLLLGEDPTTGPYLERQSKRLVRAASKPKMGAGRPRVLVLEHLRPAGGGG